MSRVWRWYLAAGLAACVTYFLLPASWGTSVFLTVAISGVLAIAWGVSRHQPARAARIWWWQAAARALWVVGDGLYLFYLQVLHQEPYPSPGDMAYLLGYVLMVVGMLLLVRKRTPGRDVASMVDATIVASGLGLLAWVFLVEPAATDTESSLLSRLTTTAYPVLDLLLLLLLVRLVVAGGQRNSAFRLMVASIATVLAADIGNALLAQVVGGADRGSVLALLTDQGYLISYVLFGAAALHPDMHALTEPVDEPRFQFTRRRLTGLAAAALLAPALLATQVLAGAVTNGAAIAVASAGLFILVVLRMNGLIQRIRRQADQLEALTQQDPLTGAANRRAWDASLPLAFDRARRDGTALTVVLLDLDRFKVFNDTHGHQAGDRLLKEAVAAWQSQLRHGDLLARYGGEEFILYLPQVPQQQAYEIVERLRQVTPLDQSFSAGLAVWNGHESGEVLLARADTAMYGAKQAGRDQIVLAAAS